METGGRWPAGLEAPPASRIVVQDPLESSDALTARSVRVIEGLRAKGQRLHSLVIAAGRGHCQTHPPSARSEVARAALAALAPGATVILAGNENLPAEARHELFATAEEITRLLVGTDSSVRVCFDAPDTGQRQPTSGIYPVVKLALPEAANASVA
jgi:hypothetical protein